MESKLECKVESTDDKQEKAIQSADDGATGFDAVFTYVGGGGRFQWLLFALTGVQLFVLANHHIGSVFLAANPDHWCRVEELHRKTSWTEEQIKNISIPHQVNEGSIKWDQCNMYDLDYDYLASNYGSFEDAYKSVNFTNHPVRPCVQWNYDHSIFESTIVTQFNLVCDNRHYAASIQASYMAGMFFGSLLGPLSDNVLGRRKVVQLAVTLVLISSYAAAYATSLTMFIALRVILATGVSGCFHNCFILLLEYSDKRYRSIIGILKEVPFALGYMTMAGFGYGFRRWDQLQFAFATFSAVLVIYFWLLPESARWLASRERDDEAIKYLGKVAKLNSRKLPEKAILVPILKTCREKKVSSDGSSLVKLMENFRSYLKNYVTLVRTPELRRRSLAIWYLYATVALVYYGAVLDSTSITNDPFLVVFLMGLMEIPAYTMNGTLVAFWGRRPSIILFFAITAASYFAFIATPQEHITIGMVLSLLGKFTVSSAYAAIYLAAAELYPTSVRMTGLGTAVIMGRVGSILAPYAVTMLRPINPKLPTAIFGVAALLGSAAGCYLPETKDKQMADVVMEVEAQVHKDKKQSNNPV